MNLFSINYKPVEVKVEAVAEGEEDMMELEADKAGRLVSKEVAASEVA